jgi:hypothetical protein
MDSRRFWRLADARLVGQSGEARWRAELKGLVVRTALEGSLEVPFEVL